MPTRSTTYPEAAFFRGYGADGRLDGGFRNRRQPVPHRVPRGRGRGHGHYAALARPQQRDQRHHRGEERDRVLLELAAEGLGPDLAQVDHRHVRAGRVDDGVHHGEVVGDGRGHACARGRIGGHGRGSAPVGHRDPAAPGEQHRRDGRAQRAARAQDQRGACPGRELGRSARLVVRKPLVTGRCVVAATVITGFIVRVT
jgi:hypothetical protein